MTKPVVSDKTFLKGLLGMLLGVGLVSGVGVAAFGNHYDFSFDQMVASSVQIGKYCSGTVIEDPDLSDGKQFTVLSAKHCLSENEKIGSTLLVNIPTVVGNEVTGDTTVNVIIKDISESADGKPESDLVLLQGMKPNEDYGIKPVKILNGLPKIGDHVWSVSFPLGETKTINDGYLGYILKNDYFSVISVSGLWQKTSISIAPGSSGSGLYKLTDDGYQLMGVLTWMDQRADYVSYYTPLTEIQEFLGKQKNEKVSS